ncbi:MAG: LPS export ABC transporter periplasmic protein LptC [Bacteroidaceae bacterium]|nr:LPS export ABC transporter periplasmic protein LptC [Bacteroidaceae bacterium]
MRKIAFFIVAVIAFLCACTGDKEHTAEAVSSKDSTTFMTANGVSTLISDSGVIRYKLIAEDWQIHTNTMPMTWKFFHGFFMERYDQQHKVDLYVQADTAYLHKQELWELRGRVIVKNLQGTLFLTEELFWNMNKKEIYNSVPMDIFMPDRELHGTEFRSNEAMTDYIVLNSSGYVPTSDTDSEVPTPPEPEPTSQSTEETDNSSQN